jgi:hypothetical protein
MKVGDLVTLSSYCLDDREILDEDYGVVMQLSRTGHESLSAKVIFMNGEEGWYDTKRLELINESR